VVLAVVALLAFCSRAEAIPVELHLIIDLESERETDPLGLGGATLEIVYDIHDVDLNGDGVYVGPMGRGAHVIVSGSASHDGVHVGAPFWAYAGSTPTHIRMGIHDFMMNLDGWFLWFIGDIHAQFPLGFAEITGERGRYVGL
jgi:hypothetical protein